MAGVHTTPAGSAAFAAVFRPRAMNRGNPNEYMAWTVGLDIEHGVEDGQKFATFLRGLFDAAHPGARPAQNSLPFRSLQDELGRPTGVWRFNFARRVLSRDGSQNSPPIVQDSKGAPWPSDVLIGNGSLIKVAFTYWKWSNNSGSGISLDLHAVRVLNLVPYEPPPPPDYAAAFGGPEPGIDAATLAVQSLAAEASAPTAQRSHGWAAPAPAAREASAPLAFCWLSDFPSSIDDEIPF